MSWSHAIVLGRGYGLEPGDVFKIIEAYKLAPQDDPVELQEGRKVEPNGMSLNDETEVLDQMGSAP